MPSKAIEQNGVLVIPNANRNDQGSYICTGSDMLEEDTAQVILIVEEGRLRYSICYKINNNFYICKLRFCMCRYSSSSTLLWPF